MRRLYSNGFFIGLLFILLLILLVIYYKKNNIVECLTAAPQTEAINNLLIISCYFGKQQTKIFPAPHKKNCVFFTNNPNLKTDIINKGWTYIYVKAPLFDDNMISSLQSKYIKFLLFLKEYPEYDNKKTIVYADHKLKILPNALYEINKLINDNLNKSVIINKSLGNKTKVYHEISEAMHQERYARNMHKTKFFVDNLISTGQISENVRICETGLLIYINKDKIKDLITSVYNKCIEHQQPECQIYWSVFSQKYDEHIKKINWSDIKNIIR